MVTITPGKDHMHLSLGLTDEQNLVLLGIAIKGLKVPSLKQIIEGYGKIKTATVDVAAKYCTESLEKHGLNTNEGLFMMGYILSSMVANLMHEPDRVFEEVGEILEEIAEKGIEI